MSKPILFRVEGWHAADGQFQLTIVTTDAATALRRAQSEYPGGTVCKVEAQGDVDAIDLPPVPAGPPAPRNYVEETVTYRGSGTDLATDLRAIVPPEKLQDMADSLVDTGHVKLTFPLPKGPTVTGSFIETSTLKSLASQIAALLSSLTTDRSRLALAAWAERAWPALDSIRREILRLAGTPEEGDSPIVWDDGPPLTTTVDALEEARATPPPTREVGRTPGGIPIVAGDGADVTAVVAAANEHEAQMRARAPAQEAAEFLGFVDSGEARALSPMREVVALEGGGYAAVSRFIDPMNAEVRMPSLRVLRASLVRGGNGVWRLEVPQNAYRAQNEDAARRLYEGRLPSAEDRADVQGGGLPSTGNVDTHYDLRERLAVQLLEEARRTCENGLTDRMAQCVAAYDMLMRWSRQ